MREIDFIDIVAVICIAAVITMLAVIFIAALDPYQKCGRSTCVCADEYGAFILPGGNIRMTENEYAKWCNGDE